MVLLIDAEKYFFFSVTYSSGPTYMQPDPACQGCANPRRSRANPLVSSSLGRSSGDGHQKDADHWVESVKIDFKEVASTVTSCKHRVKSGTALLVKVALCKLVGLERNLRRVCSPPILLK